MNTLKPQLPPQSPLLTDLYQLTMLDAYYQLGMEQTAVFEFFVRRLPDCRNFLVAAGLEQTLEYLENLRFGAEELHWLESTGLFSKTLLHRLETFRFSGDVMAMDEGTVFFASEPILRVTAPLPGAQLIESRLINLLHFQTTVASKAARCRLAAREAQLIDFGMRRAHGAEAACLAARASYIAGFNATATVEASHLYGIPLAGTMAHSFVQAHDLEADAFERFARCRPRDVVLLIDTYDTERAAKRVADLAHRLRKTGGSISGVRIDSGDLIEQSRRVRAILDGAGCQAIKILVSGNLDECVIERLHNANAPVDTYCVGTKLSTASDAPVLDCAYKLNWYAGKPRRKLSAGKETWPGPRQVYRQYGLHDDIENDCLTCNEEVAEGKALLHEVMKDGKRTRPPPSLDAIRIHCKNELDSLTIPQRSLETNCAAPVKVSALQHAMADEFNEAAR